jgi:hypothetical protein
VARGRASTIVASGNRAIASAGNAYGCSRTTVIFHAVNEREAAPAWPVRGCAPRHPAENRDDDGDGGICPEPLAVVFDPHRLGEARHEVIGADDERAQIAETLPGEEPDAERRDGRDDGVSGESRPPASGDSDHNGRTHDRGGDADVELAHRGDTRQDAGRDDDRPISHRQAPRDGFDRPGEEQDLQRFWRRQRGEHAPHDERHDGRRPQRHQPSCFDEDGEHEPEVHSRGDEQSENARRADHGPRDGEEPQRTVGEDDVDALPQRRRRGEVDGDLPRAIQAGLGAVVGDRPRERRDHGRDEKPWPDRDENAGQAVTVHETDPGPGLRLR